MDWSGQVVSRLVAAPVCGYRAGAAPAAEPTALACLALAREGQTDAAVEAATALGTWQLRDGSVPVQPDATSPGWTTSLATLAWRAVDPDKFALRIANAVIWLLEVQGKPIIPQDLDLGHDTTLVAWPWELGTHSWLEPTAFAVTALRSVGKKDHKRTINGLAVLHDRLLPDGGCNYGNTSVLGQNLRPHAHPTGVVLTALAGRADRDGRLAKSLDFLTAEAATLSAPMSLAWALLGLSAHGRTPTDAEERLSVVATRTLNRSPANHHLALLTLARQGSRSALVTPP